MRNTMTRAFVAFSIGTWIGLIGLCAFAADKTAPKDGTMRDVATCNDGSTYRNDSGRHMGACSGHQGVKAWADGSPVKSNKRHTEYLPAKGGK